MTGFFRSGYQAGDIIVERGVTYDDNRFTMGHLHFRLCRFLQRYGGDVMEFFRTIRGTEVIVHADDFDGDESVGMPYGPESVWAETFDKEPFDLTDDEVEALGIEATQIWLEDDEDL